MPVFPTVKDGYTSQQVIDTFYGYDHNLKIADGEFYDMQNLTSSYYPLLANRDRRGVLMETENYGGMLGRSHLAVVDGQQLLYNGADLAAHLPDGVHISDGEKQLVSMGAYILMFPDKLYFNTELLTDCGSMEQSASVTGSISYKLCKQDGTLYASPTVSSTAPSNPTNGKLWIDTSGSIHTLKQYSSTSGIWVQIATVYVRIEANGIGSKFSRYDGVELAGCAGNTQVEALNGKKVIYEAGDNYIVVVGMLDATYTQTGTVTLTRSVPDMDFVTESENRLWGCKYGVVNGETVNEIYCCALGDFKNWNQFLGLSTDSYAASVGSDGPWTGAVTHLGYPIFFKENYLHKVYISSTGAHQITATECRGVQPGSDKSLRVVNETLFYKSTDAVCAYDGSLPTTVSQALGHAKYYDAVAGELGDKYFISMRSDDGWSLFVYDTEKRLWHREDDFHAADFARVGNVLYMADGAQILAIGDHGLDTTEAVEWSATTGIMGYDTVEQKYVSRFNLRMKLPEGSDADLYIQYDSDGIWHHCGHMEGVGTNTFLLPVRPLRCDHFQFRIDGTGDVRIYSMSKVFEQGSDAI